ncbi:MAG: ABC transporter substrate-binding protein [Oscillospiraceae bacterium]
MPSLVTDYSVSEDGLTYSFTLREGVVFSNGSALTASDVQYSFDSPPPSPPAASTTTSPWRSWGPRLSRPGRPTPWRASQSPTTITSPSPWPMPTPAL